MFLEWYIKNGFSLWIDTCSILHDQFETCMNGVVDVLKENNCKIRITQTVINELTKHISSSNEELKANAEQKMELIAHSDLKNIFDIYNNTSNSFADNDFLALFTQLRLTEKILFITQDVALASDVWNLGDSKSVRSKRIEVAKIKKDGSLGLFKIGEKFYNNEDKGEDESIDGLYVGDLNGETTGDINGSVLGKVIGDMQGDINGALQGDITGNMLGDINGVFQGNIAGDMYGDICGVMNGDVQGDMHGDIIGTLNGNVRGNMDGDILGNLYGKILGKMT